MLDDDDEFSDEGEDEVEKKRRKKKREKQRKREEKKAAGTAGVTTTTSATIAAATGGQPSGETLCTISLNVFLLLECVLSDKYKKINFVTFFLLTFFLFFLLSPLPFSSRFLLSLSLLAFSSYRLALNTVKMDRFRRPSNDRATLIHTHTINYYIYHF